MENDKKSFRSRSARNKQSTSASPLKWRSVYWHVKEHNKHCYLPIAIKNACPYKEGSLRKTGGVT